VEWVAIGQPGGAAGQQDLEALAAQPFDRGAIHRERLAPPGKQIGCQRRGGTQV
jgi:hypothetical protein